MRVRAIDSSGDWLFGKGQNDYKTGQDALAQSINTRLKSFLGDCFFSINSGIDWFNLLGGKDQTSLLLSINAVILNTQDVTGCKQLSANVNAITREVVISYVVATTFGVTSNTFSLDLNGLG